MKHYGYKVCYRIRASDKPKRRFITHSFKAARDIKNMYYRYPPPDEHNKPISNVNWEIHPITRKDIKKGIWKECPF